MAAYPRFSMTHESGRHFDEWMRRDIVNPYSCDQSVQQTKRKRDEE